MAFLALGIETSFLSQEKDSLEFEELVLQNAYNGILEEQANHLEEGGQADDDYSQYLEAQQELYDARKTTIETRLKTINSQIDSYAKVVDNNIKQNCKLSISV